MDVSADWLMGLRDGARLVHWDLGIFAKALPAS